MLLGGEVRYAGMVHCVAIQIGFGMDVYFGNTMIDLYVKWMCILAIQIDLYDPS